MEKQSDLFGVKIPIEEKGKVGGIEPSDYWGDSKECNEMREKLSRAEEDCRAFGFPEKNQGIEVNSISDFKKVVAKIDDKFAYLLKVCVDLNEEFYRKLRGNPEDYEPSKEDMCACNIHKMFKFTEENALFKSRVHNHLLSQKKVEPQIKEEKLELKVKKNVWVYEDLNIADELPYVTYVDFESEHILAKEMLSSHKKIVKGFKKVRVTKEGKEERFGVNVGCCVKGIEGIVSDYEQELKNPDEIREWIATEKECDSRAVERNNAGVFFDGRRYFWKLDRDEFGKDMFVNLGFSPEDEKEAKAVREKAKKESIEKGKLEEEIKRESESLKELLKEKFGYEVTIKIFKKENENAVQGGKS